MLLPWATAKHWQCSTFAGAGALRQKVLRQSIYGAGAEAFWHGVCHSWQNTELGAALLQQSLPADVNAKTLVLELFRQLLPQEPVYWFIDDLHLLESSEAVDFLLL